MTPSPATSWTLSARWVFPVSSPPIPDGVVTIAAERIVSVEPRGRQAIDVDLGDAAILPGLVNCHTHLDLTGLRGQCPPSTDFTGWLRQVIAHRRATPPEQIEADIRAGLAESVRHGTTLLGDISAGGCSWDMLADAPLHSVVFYELLGLPRKRAEQSLAAASRWLASRPASDRCRPGLSPHAPYSVHESLLVDATLLARDHNYPLAVHLAESREENELLRRRRGPFVRFLKDLDVWNPGGLVRTSTDVLYITNMGMPRLFIHCNYLAPAARIPGDATVVYCPRTHTAFGHRSHPLRRFLARGVRVALGTDSLASNPDLSVLAEMRHLHRHHPDVSGDVLLRMATLSGSEALGWADETGSLEAGKSADLVVVPLSPEAAGDPYRRLLGSDIPVQRVLWRGQWTVTHQPEA